MTVCPPRQLLASYEHGELNDAEAELLERHLEGCGHCRTAMTRIRDSDNDTRVLRNVVQSLQDGHHGEAGAATAPTAAGTGTTVLTRLPLQEGATEREVLGRVDLGSAEWTIPDYERIALCGEGAYGSVWAVRDRVGVHRALKIIDLDRMKRLGVVCREQSALEAYCRRVPRHPHLITVNHVGVVGNILYYTMELADDGSRGRIVDEKLYPGYHPLTLKVILGRRRLHVEAALEITRRLLSGLAELHRVGLIHRDIKPSNIVFVDGRPKLADIGIVTTDQETSKAIGTPPYMPPDRVMDRTADTFAMGKVLYQMLAGADDRTYPDLPEDPRWEGSQWDRIAVGNVIAQAGTDQAAKRYPSATAMLEDLEQCVDLTAESLFDRLEDAETAPAESTAREAIRLGYALLRTIPWIFGIIALLFAISRMTR